MKHGYGTYTLPDGRKYEGIWTYGVMNGRFIYTNAVGRVRAGFWD